MSNRNPRVSLSALAPPASRGRETEGREWKHKRKMDENIDPHRAVHGSKDFFAESSPQDSSGVGSSNTMGGEAVADRDVPLLDVLRALEDGKVAIVGDLVAIRAGPHTYHPVKALKGMASESDVIILSCLTKAPSAGEATSAVRSALQRVVVRAPLAMIHNLGPGGLPTTAAAAAAAAAGGAGIAPNLRVISPCAHSAVIDSNLLRSFTVARARTILAGLSPLPAGNGDRTRQLPLPTVVAGVAGGPAGLCFLGQRATPEGFSVFSIRRESEPEKAVGATAAAAAAAPGSRGQALRIDDLIHEFGGRAQASARALYDLCGTSNGDVLAGTLGEGLKRSPFARLATEWDCSSHATRTLGSAPPPACSSLLMLGGECPPSAASLELRRNVETLSMAAAMGQATATPGARRKAAGPFGPGGRGAGDDDSADLPPPARTGDVDPSEAEELLMQKSRWDEDLQALLSGSEHMAELAARPRDARTGDDQGDYGSAAAGGTEEDTAVQGRKDGGRLGKEDIASSRQEQVEKLRGDLDFSERLWELAARARDVDTVRSAFSSAFDAVGDGQIFPSISRDNKTAAGSHIRDGVAMAREARYNDGAAVGVVAVPRDEAKAKAKAWRKRGAAMLADANTLARAFVELGVHKVTRDVLHGLEVHAGVLAVEVDHILPLAAAAAAGDESSSSDRAGDPKLDRLLKLADTLDLVALAQSYGASWRQVRAVAHSGLATLRRPPYSSTAGPSPRSPSPVFSVGLPRPIPPRARCKLAHPVFWELYLESKRGDGVEASMAGEVETVSYAMAKDSLFQLKGVDEPMVLSGEAARTAQAALRGVAEHLIPEVLSSVTGVESFVELKRRQLEARAKRGSPQSDAAAVFVCEHRFTPW